MGTFTGNSHDHHGNIGKVSGVDFPLNQSIESSDVPPFFDLVLQSWIFSEVLFATHYHPVSKKAVEDTAKVSDCWEPGKVTVFCGGQHRKMVV